MARVSFMVVLTLKAHRNSFVSSRRRKAYYLQQDAGAKWHLPGSAFQMGSYLQEDAMPICVTGAKWHLPCSAFQMRSYLQEDAMLICVTDLQQDASAKGQGYYLQQKADNHRQPQTTQHPQPLTEHGSSPSAAPPTNSARGGSQSAAPATNSARQQTSEYSNHNGGTDRRPPPTTADNATPTASNGAWRFTKCCACHELW